MNPALILLILIGGVALWFLASGLYKPLGRFIHKIGQDAIDELNDTEEDEKKETLNNKEDELK